MSKINHFRAYMVERKDGAMAECINTRGIWNTTRGGFFCYQSQGKIVYPTRSLPFTTPTTEPTYSPDEPGNYEVG